MLASPASSSSSSHNASAVAATVAATAPAIELKSATTATTTTTPGRKRKSTTQTAALMSKSPKTAGNRKKREPKLPVPHFIPTYLPPDLQRNQITVIYLTLMEDGDIWFPLSQYRKLIGVCEGGQVFCAESEAKSLQKHVSRPIIYANDLGTHQMIVPSALLKRELTTPNPRELNGTVTKSIPWATRKQFAHYFQLFLGSCATGHNDDGTPFINPNYDAYSKAVEEEKKKLAGGQPPTKLDALRSIADLVEASSTSSLSSSSILSSPVRPVAVIPSPSTPSSSSTTTTEQITSTIFITPPPLTRDTATVPTPPRKSGRHPCRTRRRRYDADSSTSEEESGDNTEKVKRVRRPLLSPVKPSVPVTRTESGASSTSAVTVVLPSSQPSDNTVQPPPPSSPPPLISASGAYSYHHPHPSDNIHPISTPPLVSHHVTAYVSFVGYLPLPANLQPLGVAYYDPRNVTSQHITILPLDRNITASAQLMPAPVTATAPSPVIH